MTDLECTDVLCAKHRPAHRAPASFECRREFNLEFHFMRWGEGRKYCGVRASITYGRCITVEASEARCKVSSAFKGCESIVVLKKENFLISAL